MKRILLASVASVAVLAGASVAGAQTWQDQGYPGRSMNDRVVGMQVGPLDADMNPQPMWGYAPRRALDNDTYDSRAFHSQENWPQSPPGGGY